MKYGCIGEHLKHSFSKEIHNAFAEYEYEIREIPKDELDAFMTERDFWAINVTIPYKEKVIPHLTSIDAHAASIGAVNTIVNRDGKLYGYNTDFYGMRALLAHAGIQIGGKKVAILGTGGTAKTAKAVVSALGAREIITVSRSAAQGVITYEELYAAHTDAEVLINTTPVGMYPNIFGKPVNLSCFPKLSGAMDAVYNPLETPFILEAKSLGVPAEGGLYMLVAQAVRASEIFLDTVYEPQLLEQVFTKIKQEKQNVVLIGMPGAGKTTIGGKLAKIMDRPLLDIDDLIEELAGKSPAEIINEHGERYFREIESQVVRETASKTGVIIATGGGIILNNENVTALSENGRIFFIDRPLEDLLPTADRPLSATREAITQRYNERYDRYLACADVQICVTGDADHTAEQILEAL